MSVSPSSSVYSPKIGRPSMFTQALVDEICERLSEGEPLAVICRDDHMPSAVTVGNWSRKDDNLSSALAHARETGHDTIAWRSRKVIYGEEGFSTGDVLRDKYIVEHEIKLLAIWNPRYSAKARVELTGADGGALQIEQRQVLDIAALDYDGREALRAALEAASANAALDVTPRGGEDD